MTGEAITTLGYAVLSLLVRGPLTGYQVAARMREFGWLPTQGGQFKRPDENTLWRQEGGGALTVEHPVTLVYDNGEGLAFRRTVSNEAHGVGTSRVQR